MLLGPPVAAHQIRRDPEQPGAQRAEARVESCAAAIRRGERLRRQVLSDSGADPAGDEPVHQREMLAEGSLKIFWADHPPSA